MLATHDVNELIVTDSDYNDRELVDIVEHAHRRGVKVRVAPRASELLIERRGEYVPGEGVPLFELRPPVFVGTDWVVKRTFDLAMSSVVAVLGLPFWLLIAAAIKLDSRGPVLYRDTRIGLTEQEFGMFKFRTMRADAAAMQPQLEAENEAEGALFKIADDPRVTRVGRFLRRYSIDEVPQVLNVLRGEMSLVGPRPLPIRDFELLEPWHRKRYLVLPGMTGLWQIAGRSTLGFDDLVRLDFYYLEHWSIWLDISILLKTIPAVLARRGAYSGFRKSGDFFDGQRLGDHRPLRGARPALLSGCSTRCGAGGLAEVIVVDNGGGGPEIEEARGTRGSPRRRPRPEPRLRGGVESRRPGGDGRRPRLPEPGHGGWRQARSLSSRGRSRIRRSRLRWPGFACSTEPEKLNARASTST